jgi:putative drug exporter of the RND superfamily
VKSHARFIIAHRKWVVIGWIVLIVGLQGIAHALGGSAYKDTFSLPHTETAKVATLLKNAGLDSENGATGTVVLHSHNGAFTGAPSSLEPALAALCSAGDHVALIQSPWQSINCADPSATGPGNPQLLNTARGANTGLVQITWAAKHYDQSSFLDVYNRLKTLRTSDLQVEFTGNAFGGVGQSGGAGPSLFIGFAAALIILAIVFRTAAATALPLASAAVALIGGLAAVEIMSHAVNVSNITPYLAELMVIGVGVDYALFIVTRHRRNLRRGMSVPDSIATAINTSGRAVLFAGTTVCIAILGLIALGVSFFNGMAVATSLAVAFTMLASLTLLPALLSFFGLKVLPRKQRAEVRAGRFIGEIPQGRWARWADFVASAPVGVALVSGILIVVLALPFFSLQLGQSDQSSDPKGSTTRTGYDLISSNFGVGYNSTLEAVVNGSGASDPTYLAKVASTLKSTPGVDPTSIGTAKLKPDIAFISFKSTTSPQSEKTYQLVRDLRSTVLPPLYSGTPNHVYVYGDTAINVDFAKVLTRKMPLFIAVVVGLSFLLLLIAFRSVVIPATAAVMNLLAAGGAFGLTVAVFQYGWGSDSIGAGPGGPIDAWIPVMLFAILFGLSMDYQVFLVSRMHEEWVHTEDNERAVTVGQAETGGIITAAAIIMIAVFLGFMLSPGRTIKIFGFGLAAAVFLDAFILRTMLVPSLMHVFGKWNWYFPRWLNRITPHVSVEPHDEDDDAVPGGGPLGEDELAQAKPG